MKKFISIAIVAALLPLTTQAMFDYQKRQMVEQYQTSSTSFFMQGDKERQIDALLARRARNKAEEQTVDEKKEVVLRPAKLPAKKPIVDVNVITCAPPNYSAMSTQELIKFIKQLMDLIVKD